MLYKEARLSNYAPEDDRWLNLINLDALFAISPNAVILNRIDSSASDYVKRRNAYIFDRAGSLGFIAHCNCGNLTGNLNVNPPGTPPERRIKCVDCGTECRDDFSSEEQLEHNVWLSMPSSIPGVLHPIAYIVLSYWLSRRNGPNFIDAIIDPTLDLPPELEGVVLGRGHAYFYENFDRLMAYFLHYFRTVDKRSKTKRENADYIEQFITAYRSVMFCTHLPVMSSVLHSITSADGSGEGKQYADASLQGIQDAATDLQHVEETTMRTRPKAVPTIVHRVYKTYIAYIQDIARTRLSKKKSLVRGHMLGTRLHFSARSVIIPHSGRYDELYLPWALTVNLLKLHIIGRLVRKQGMAIGEATLRHLTALVRYDPMIDQIMKDLVCECRPNFPGLPFGFNRNPKN